MRHDRADVGAKPPSARYIRDFTQEYRLTSRSLPEICETVKGVVVRLGLSRRVLFRGRKLTNEAFINAAALYLCELEPTAQEAILERYIARIEGMMRSETLGSENLRD